MCNIKCICHKSIGLITLIKYFFKMYFSLILISLIPKNVANQIEFDIACVPNIMQREIKYERVKM